MQSAGSTPLTGVWQALHSPPALRTRVIRLMCLQCGSPADALGVDHVRRVEELVTGWKGQGEVALPGGVTAARAYGRLGLRSSGRPLRE